MKQNGDQFNQPRKNPVNFMDFSYVMQKNFKNKEKLGKKSLVNWLEMNENYKSAMGMENKWM